MKKLFFVSILCLFSSSSFATSDSAYREFSNALNRSIHHDQYDRVSGPEPKAAPINTNSAAVDVSPHKQSSSEQHLAKAVIQKN